MDNSFSIESEKYAHYRPDYLAEIIQFISSLAKNKDNAWDCGTGSGQVAVALSVYFNKIFATDISRSQLDHAAKRENIEYSVQPAEMTSFNAKFFDLIVVAQAIHWFDFNRFYAEVYRTAKDTAIIAVLGYGRIHVSDELDKIISHFYSQVIGPFWDKERRYIDENYQTIPFPFKEIDVPHFENTFDWTFNHLIAYLETWSAVKKFRAAKGFNPLEQIRGQLLKEWGDRQYRRIRFPVLLRVGQI